MRNNSTGSTFRQIIGLFVVLGIAFGFEILLEYLRIQNAKTFNLNYVVLGAYLLASFLVSVGMFLLFWSGINQSSGRTGIGILFLVIGLLILLGPILYYTPFLPKIIRIFPQPLLPRSIFYFSGGMAAAGGLMMIVLPKRKNSF